MQEKIKSQKILRKIFSFLEEKDILLMANYNKSLQTKLRRSLINYKLFSGKYIKCEINTKGKIYNAFNNKILYEGEFYNNKRHGKGREYYDNEEGNLKFEGEYLNGKRNGKGKEYDEFGNLIFEGEYLNDYKKTGKEYIYNKLEYKGEYLNNKKWTGKGYDKIGNIANELNDGKGNIREYYKLNGNIKYEGVTLNGKRNGKGKEYNKFGRLIFEGEYLNEKEMEKEKNIMIMAFLKVNM